MNKTLVANDLLPVYQTTDTGEQVIDARELHGFLNVSSRYNDWIKNRIEKFVFIENEDFTALTENLVSGGKQSVHILKLDMAKELAMVENNEQGRKARRYFIEVEKRFKQGNVPKVPLANMEHDKLTKLLQILRMAERERLFTPETDKALRLQIAEIVLNHPVEQVATPATTQPARELPPWENPDPTTYAGEWYLTTNIAKLAGVSVNMIGKLATKHNMRVPKYCSMRKADPTKRSGLTQVWYNEAGKNEFLRTIGRLKRGNR